MDHALHAIDRSSIRYWIDGNGFWATRWECTSGDALLLAINIVGILWMVTEYFRYAYKAKRAKHLFADEGRKIYLDRLMQVFLFCGMIHLINIVCWFWTPHIMWALCYYANAALSHSLNSTFSAAVEKSVSDSEAESRLQKIATALSEVAEQPEEPKSLRELAEELRKMVG